LQQYFGSASSGLDREPGMQKMTHNGPQEKKSVESEEESGSFNKKPGSRSAFGFSESGSETLV
jgi:hypothetical protein